MRCPPSRQWRRAFTLIEVVLAIGIAIGLLLVVLYFHRQAAELRSQLLVEAERVSAVRLVMDRMTTDLRCAYGMFSEGGGISGDSSSLRIVKTEVLPRVAWGTGKEDPAAPRSLGPLTDLRMVTYSLGGGGSNSASGLLRVDEPLVQRRVRVDPAKSGTNVVSEATPAVPEPVTDAIQYLRFRYWDGSSWLDSWSDTTLPAAVEVTLAVEPPPEEALSEASADTGFRSSMKTATDADAATASSMQEEPPRNLFRRVMLIPGATLGSGGFDEFSMELGGAP